MAVKKIQNNNQMSFQFGDDSVAKVHILKEAVTEPESDTRTIDRNKKAKIFKEVPQKKSSRKSSPRAATAESMAAKQRDISISEFFAKNRHLLGFDNPRKSLLTAVKEAVDNSLDACEEAHILPDITIVIQQLSDKKYSLLVRDNGPGIVKKQVPNIFARLLYGSKFHSLKMSRGQQGIGISAAGMYGLITTGEPVQIISRTKKNKPAHHYHVQIDTAKNSPVIVLDEETDFDLPTGTQVTITLEGKYLRGKQSVDEYIAQTAMANPHATFIYTAPDETTQEYIRQSKKLPFIPIEIKPHPYGVELGLLCKMAKESSERNISTFLHKDFSRVSTKLATDICKRAKLSPKMRTSAFSIKQGQALYEAINETKIMSPPVNCIGPIGEEELEQGLRRVVAADFYSSCSRKPAVYRGNPFLVEAAIAYGFKSENSKNNDEDNQPSMQLKRLANRVPLLYQQGGCAVHKAVIETNWRNYGLSQSRGALPAGPIMLMVHIASVWVPFTSESKEAIAHYPEIIKEIKLAVQECGRKLGIYLRRQKRIKQELQKRSYIETYLPYIGQALQEILNLKEKQVDAVVENLKEVLEKSRKM